ncbi:MAG TPA: TraM recognition domain-containing protein [Streptosporangiaceae bacterium]|nr:TraM recognition domain-containing protein [Streptosporangiaceae bacterium]
MIAEGVSEEAPVGPLLAAMATEIRYAAAQTGQASQSGRLGPPLLMGLDEVTQICPVPLPSWLSDSGGKGIQVCAVVHGEAQLASRWGNHGRQVVLDTSSIKVFLLGVTDTTTLEAASTPCGQASWKVRGQDHVTRHDVATTDMIRQLPVGYALIIPGGCAPVIARLPRAWKNPAYRRTGPAPALPAAQSAPYPVFVSPPRSTSDHISAEDPRGPSALAERPGHGGRTRHDRTRGSGGRMPAAQRTYPPAGPGRRTARPGGNRLTGQTHADDRKRCSISGSTRLPSAPGERTTLRPDL